MHSARRGGVDHPPMKATITESFADATVEALFAEIATLDRYPRWMRLVHERGCSRPSLC